MNLKMQLLIIKHLRILRFMGRIAALRPYLCLSVFICGYIQWPRLANRDGNLAHAHVPGFAQPDRTKLRRFSQGEGLWTPQSGHVVQVARTPKEVGRSRRERRREGRRSRELPVLRRGAARSASAPYPKRVWATRPDVGGYAFLNPRCWRHSSTHN